MQEIDVRIEKLSPLRIASVRAISENPETDAWEILVKWAKPKGFFDEKNDPLVFGFNNPSPSPGKSRYGYEFWLSIPEHIIPADEIELMDFSGGLYAATTHKGFPNPTIWKQLWDWVQASSIYQWRKTHELERMRNPKASSENMVFDLYLPIEEKAAGA